FQEWFGANGELITILVLISPFIIFIPLVILGIIGTRESEDVDKLSLFALIAYIPAIILTYVCFNCAKYIELEIKNVFKFLAVFVLILFGSAYASKYIDPQMEDLLVQLPRPPMVDQ
ncbi:MAG TPA: hypothetical protein VFV30_00645, partial [Novosphingobium sp.]|nr:hypothetical protein [Novosphingobium sp.]